MMDFDVRLTQQAERFLADMSKRCPREVRRALGLASGIVRSRMRAMMRGRKSPLAPWTDTTRRIREKQNRPWSATFGGRMVYPKAKQLAIVPNGDYCRIGWVDALENAAKKFQDGGTVNLSTSFRHALYVRGYDGKLPEVEEQQPRHVVAPVAEEARAKFPEWMSSILEKVLKGAIETAERGYAKATTDAQRLRHARNAARGYATLASEDIRGALTA